MAKFRLDYIWLDGYQPTANIRTRAQIVETDKDEFSLDDAPIWRFDGSSGQQAEGHGSNCILRPVSIYNNPLHDNACCVLCGDFARAGERHESSYRA